MAEANSNDVANLFSKQVDVIQKPIQIGNSYELYLSGEIVEPETYIEWLDCIRSATSKDEIRIYINSEGGNVFSAIQLMNALQTSEAHIVAVVEGWCCSAATFIFLCADEFEIAPHSAFMFHNYSAGMSGKGGEMAAQVDFFRVWSSDLLKEIYKDFLTLTEIEMILNNQDIWQTAEEITKRLRKKIKAAKKQSQPQVTQQKE